MVEKDEEWPRIKVGLVLQLPFPKAHGDIPKLEYRVPAPQVTQQRERAQEGG